MYPFLIYLSLCLCYGSLISGSSIMSERLFENLGRFHLNQPALPPIKPDQIGPTPLASTDVWMEVFRYLDFGSLLRVSEGNKDSNRLVRLYAARTLAAFNPHYLFNEDWINLIVLKLKMASFPASMNLKSDGIQDRLELMTLKFLTGSRINPHFLAFVHETVYGIDAQIPSDIDKWRLDFIRRSQEFKLPLTRSGFIEYYRGNNDDCEAWIEAFDFLASNPSIPEQVRFCAARNQLNQTQAHYLSAHSTLPSDFETIFNENLLLTNLNSLQFDKIVSEAAFKSINWTPEIVARVHREIESRETRKPRLTRLFYRKFPHLFPKFDPFLHLSTRDSLNRLNEDSFLEDGFNADEMVGCLAKLEMVPYLTKIDLIEKLNRIKTDNYYS